MFAAIASGNPLQLSTEVPNSNGLQHTIVLSETISKIYSHITLFILPNTVFPPNYLAIIYFKLSPTEDFRLFGYLGVTKQSAIFKVKLANADIPDNNHNTIGSVPGEGLGEIDMGDDNGIGGMQGVNNLSQLLIGISIEPIEQATMKLEQWRAEQGQQSLVGTGPTTKALVLNKATIGTPGQLAQAYPFLAREMASKIVQHAYNYLSGFVDSAGRIPMKNFETWWDKFQKRLENDATFLDGVTKE